jgi:hypothetical protein
VEIPFVSHSLIAYQATLEALAAREIEMLIPGHGRATADPFEIRARLDFDRTYLAELRARLEAAIRAGQPPAEAVAACTNMLIRHPTVNAEPHRMNIESAYVELGGPGEWWDVGWGAEHKDM